MEIDDALLSSFEKCREGALEPPGPEWGLVRIVCIVEGGGGVMGQDSWGHGDLPTSLPTIHVVRIGRLRSSMFVDFHSCV